MQDISKNRRTLREALLLMKQQKNPGSGGDARLAVAEAPRMNISGKLQIEAVYEDGTKKMLLDDKNLVVRQAEEIMPFMALGLKQFGYIELGDPSPAVAPTLDDIVLQQTTGQRKAIAGSTSGNQLICEAQWLTSEGNGFVYTEAGLFVDPFGAGELFARKVFDGITKTAAFSLKFKWAIVFRVADHGPGCTGVSLLGSSTLAHDYVYTATGGEASIVVPIDFTVGGKQLDVFLNGQRLVYNAQYYESVIGVLTKGIILMGFTANPGDVFYFVLRRLA